MRARLRSTGVLLLIAFRNLFASRARTLIVGGIVLVGAALVVVGSSLVDTIDEGMRGSVQGSLAGNLQIYEARSKDDLALYGGMTGESRLEPIEDFARLKRVLQAVPAVREVVPMGIDQAMIAAGNDLDLALEKLRADVRAREAPAGAPDLEARYAAHKAHVRRMTEVLKDELSQARVLADDALRAEREKDWQDLETAASPPFWERFDEDPLAALEFLENRVAPQSMSNGFIFIRYAGTDLAAYGRAFDRMQVVEGTPVPEGRRGILLGKLYAEDWLKLKPARTLDRMKEAREVGGRRIAGDEELTRWARDVKNQTREILLQLDPVQAAEAAARLRRALPSEKPELKDLLVELFTLDDAGFDHHHAVFYRELAPLLRLYAVRVGDTITVKAATRSGYMTSVNLKVYGFVEFRGLEKSTAAGYLSLMDLVSWRDLYGFMTGEKAAEISELKAASGARDVSREEAEAALFGDEAGGASSSAPTARDTAGDVSRSSSGAAPAARPALDLAAPRVEGAARREVEAARAERVYGQQEIDTGVALNAAVVLRDGWDVKDATREVKAALAADGLDMKVVDWQQAAGLLGQFISLARMILYIAVFFIFGVALVIINNAMVMATLQRVKEIGTLRAIGAQRRFVLWMVLLETGAVGLAFGAVGALLGALAVLVIRLAGGIPAGNDQLYFFFAGPSLLPRLGAGSLAVALAIVAVVSLASGLYPAIVATRVTPVDAMAADD